MIEILGAGDQPLNFFGAEDDRQASSALGIRQVFFHVPPLQHPEKEKPEGGNHGHHGAHFQLPLFEQEHLVAPEIVRTDAIEPSAGVAAKGLDDPQITLASRGGVLATDELLVQPLQ